jgi:malonyl-CoA O-methyltransferase
MRTVSDFLIQTLSHATRVSQRQGHRARTQLSVEEAYRLWAPQYATETVTSVLDETLAKRMLDGHTYTRLLDAGCGIGRRIEGIQHAVGLDQSAAMLAAGGARPNCLHGDVRAMPLPDASFDMIWCRLVLGHLPDPGRAYAEFSRVCRPGGLLFVTDFHPEAAQHGHQRTLTDARGMTHTVEHYVHQRHAQLAFEHGFDLLRCEDAAVDASVRSFYQAGIGERAYKRDKGLKLVAGYLFLRQANTREGLRGQSADTAHTAE